MFSVRFALLLFVLCWRLRFCSLFVARCLSSMFGIVCYRLLSVVLVVFECLMLFAYCCCRNIRLPYTVAFCRFLVIVCLLVVVV